MYPGFIHPTRRRLRPPRPTPRLEKWYVDCVSPSGAGLIAYWARLRIGPFALRFSQSLRWGADGAAVSGRLAHGVAPPIETPEGVAWECTAPPISGRWRRRGAALAPAVLHAGAAGEIVWTCCCPAADAVVTVGGERLAGSGYAERLALSPPLDRLPFRELRWGRFVAGDQSCVWIGWRGEGEKTWCFHNGVDASGAKVDRDGPTWDGRRVRLGPGRVLRSGPLAASVFSGSPPWRWLLPRSVGRIEETKWCSPAVLAGADGSETAGWAIHEEVVFR